MTIPYWPVSLPQSPAVNAEFAPEDVRTTFRADLGEPISRPRTTGAPFILEGEFTFVDAQIAAFEAFYADDLGQGAQRFIWRDPIGGGLRYWRFLPVYRRRFPVKNIAKVQVQMMMLPGVPWFAPYGLEGLSTVPSFVADYDNEVYGIAGVRKTAADLPGIEGTYDVARTVSGTTTTTEETLTAGDIPSTAPLNTTLIVGYPA
jgi:hypothetical protein